MSEATANDKRLYEGLFLFNPTKINSSVQQATEMTQEILDRANAETIAISKWDDRKMAYGIEKQSRGLYILAYFNCVTDQVKHIERDVNLSEEVMRVMLLRADQMGEAELEAAKVKADENRTAAATQAKAEADKAAGKEEAKAEPASEEAATEAPAAEAEAPAKEESAD